MHNSQFIKSVFDRVVAAITLVILSPVILAIAILIYVNMGRPIIFAQPRPGKNSRIFTFYKFRTMVDDPHETAGDDPNFTGKFLPDAHRVTSLGAFLRKTSLDELPQLWNVLKGDMSFVGPRPLRVSYLARYSPEQARRHDVVPGITGLAQINGRNLISWDERFKLDVWYVEHWSLWLDLKILLLTVLKVIQREGVASQGAFTMEEFKGQLNK